MIDRDRVDSNKVSTVHGNADALDRLTSAIEAEGNREIAVFYINQKKNHQSATEGRESNTRAAERP